ncbi:MAG TPA: hypothetical protein VGM64_06355 [Lacunisphaera sp.]|jgi:hypothetical protein
MRALFLCLMLLPAAALSEVLRLEAGAPGAVTDPVMKKIGAIDITRNLEIEDPKGEWPLHGLYWSAPDYKVIFETSDSVAMCYWTEEDFGRSKMHREDSRRYARSIAFDTEKKTFTAKKKSWWQFWK